MYLEHPQQVSAGHGAVISGGCADSAVSLIDFPALLQVVHRHHCAALRLLKQEAWINTATVNEHRNHPFLQVSFQTNLAKSLDER